MGCAVIAVSHRAELSNKATRICGQAMVLRSVIAVASDSQTMKPPCSRLLPMYDEWRLDHWSCTKPNCRENPLREGLMTRRTPEPCVLVVFGATGDLTHRKLVPALYNLAHEGQLPSSFGIVGFARRPKTNEEFRVELQQGVQQFSRFSPINPDRPGGADPGDLLSPFRVCR